MPFTAKFSRNFCERLGDDIANELVDLVNMIDGTYRSELREQNEINFARFDAKLEQRLAELRGDLRAEIAGLGTNLRKEIAEQGATLRQEIATHTCWVAGLWAAQMTAFLIIGFAVLQKRP